jgi:hypothetical protein
MREDDVEVHLLERHSPVLDLPAGDQGEISQKGFRLVPAVALNVGEGNAAPLGRLFPRRLKHGKGFVYARRIAQEDPELPSSTTALLGLGLLE